MVVVAVITGSSASGLACMKTLLGDSLNTSGMKVRGCFRSQARADEIYHQLAENGLTTATSYESVVGVDASDIDSLKRALEGADRALLVTPLDYGAGVQDDAAKSINMVRAAQRAGVKRIVHVGSWTVNAPDRMLILAPRFVPTEEFLLSEVGSSMEWTVLRGGYFMDNIIHVHQASIVERDELAAEPDFLLPPVKVQDIGEAAARLLQMDEESYRSYNHSFVECCGPENLSRPQIAERLSAGLGRTIHAAKVEECKADNPIMDELYRYMADEKSGGVPFDPVTFSRILGRSPTSVEQWAASNKSLFEKK